MRPLPGRVLVKPVETAETLAGGRILLPEATREAWTMGQCEVVDVGGPAPCDDEDCERLHEDGCHPVDPRLVPGAWVLCKPRRFVQTPDGQMVMQDDIVGIFVTALAAEILT